MGVTVIKLNVMGGRAARVLKAIREGKVTEFQVKQAVDRALDELVGGGVDEDLGLTVAVEAATKKMDCPTCSDTMNPDAVEEDAFLCPSCGTTARREF